jgi:mono/diheme cytochrome c family protein
MGQASATPSFSIQSYPIQPPNAIAGLTIYQEYCSECHGIDGTGTVPAARDFRDVDYMRGETPASFYTAITEGQGEMPGYADELTSDDRWDVVFYIWQMSTSANLIETGRSLYDRDCASCHGADGAAELLAATNFTDLRHMSNRAPRDLYTILTQGSGSMPAYQSLLNQEDRWAILDYLRTFTYEPSLEDTPVTVTPEESPTEGVACSSDQPNPFAWDDTDAIEAGQAQYQSKCSGCHGTDGSGGLPNTPDFTSAEVNSEMIGKPGDYYCALTEGEGSMPAYGETLSDDERWMLITYLASLGQ